MGEVKEHKCKVPGCNFKTTDGRSFAGHMSGHRKKGDHPRKKGDHPQEAVKVVAPEYPPDIGDRLLDAFLDRLESLKRRLENQNQLRELVTDLEKKLAKAEEERDRVLKTHNEQVTSLRMQSKQLQRVKRVKEVVGG